MKYINSTTQKIFKKIKQQQNYKKIITGCNFLTIWYKKMKMV
jgi:hypothetical protein